MSWRLKVRHSTTYEYSGVVHASYNEARISPLDTPSQFTLEHRVEVHPAANLFRYRDYWGSRVHAFDLHQPHTGLSVVGTSLVETAQRTPVPRRDGRRGTPSMRPDSPTGSTSTSATPA